LVGILFGLSDYSISAPPASDSAPDQPAALFICQSPYCSSPPRHQTSVPAIDVEEQQLLLFSALVEPPAPLTFLEVLEINHPIFIQFSVIF